MNNNKLILDYVAKQYAIDNLLENIKDLRKAKDSIGESIALDLKDGNDSRYFKINGLIYHVQIDPDELEVLICEKIKIEDQ